MATIKSVIGRNTGASSRATQFKKSAKTSASVFTAESNQRTLRNIRQNAMRAKQKADGGTAQR